MTISHRLRVDVDGRIEFIYTDELARALSAVPATSTIVRASHVEPASTYCGGCSRPYDGVDVCRCGAPRRPVADDGWVADMAPVGGPLLGTYVSREDALQGERDWLRANRGL